MGPRPSCCSTDLSAAPGEGWGAAGPDLFAARTEILADQERDGHTPSIAFALSTRGAKRRAWAPKASGGLLTSVEFRKQADTVLVIHFKAASRVQIDVIPGGDQVIHLKMRPAGPIHPAVAINGPPPPGVTEPDSADEGL